MSEYVLFIDLLGFKNSVKKDENKARDLLLEFYEIIFNEIVNEQKIKGNAFSDSFIANSTDLQLLINFACRIYRRCFNYSFLEPTGRVVDKDPILPRGAISKGDVDIKNLNELENLKKNFIVSNALVHSAEIHDKVKGARLIISAAGYDEISGIEEGIEPIIFQNTEIKVWESHIYYDVLWFHDKSQISEDVQATKSYIERLKEASLKILAKVKQSQNEEYLSQYTQTARILLLDYSNYIESNSDEVIKYIVNEYESEVFWEMWLLLLECIHTKSNEWLFANETEMVLFIKKIVQSTGWSNLLKYINQKGNEYEKKVVENFINEMKCGL
ncbi:MAG: hypothetical protein AB7V16_11020 [Vulcanibacillus sp.]